LAEKEEEEEEEMLLPKVEAGKLEVETLRLRLRLLRLAAEKREVVLRGAKELMPARAMEAGCWCPRTTTIGTEPRGGG
jgi:hypothetical protein